ncbi:hypothetical protein Lepto7376_3234 [[Leptolyngbya] sp. PCC 7376]|uniref:O-linked N-acetylglucosamine transferase family protein n=1 Tax=[Leptolyngbya] sp. PCC 7376 TaxID=111781 RepID=UPI00029EDD6B|nr:hypothetical protein [[Leptolyngbya] sp. PCC 7376]AFY39462.1 hypothetical protein Lepto7376_3234 [[Leptolyngbya] sp. PCC 7376]
MSTLQKPNIPDFNPSEILQLFLVKDIEAIATQYLNILSYFEQRVYTQLPTALKVYLEQFLNNFFYLFTQREFVLPEQYSRSFIRCNRIIANLAAITSFQNTDTYLKILLSQTDNLNKILTLYSPRNEIYVDYNKIFTSNSDLACYWYSNTFSHYLTGLADEKVAERIKFHCAYDHPHLTHFYNHPDLYFGSTYIDPKLDRILKYKINFSLQQNQAAQITIQNQPDPKKIAIVSGFWYPQHSVYRTLSQYIAALKNDYELTLINFGNDYSLVDTKLFKKVIYLESKDGSLNLDALRENQFSLVYFADVGMSAESIVLANMRLAPIQCCGMGHSVSTYGSKIDYFFSGQSVEIPEGAEQFYSEKLKLLPGAGVIHNQPNYERLGRSPVNFRVVINCPWSAQKINVPLLNALKRITEKAVQPPLFRFFCGSSLRQNSYLAFAQDIETILPREYFELVPAIAYQDYMKLMEAGDIALDSFHFGGCNSVVDSLYLHKPTVVFEGDRWYNRIGAHILRQVGLMDLIATTEQDYIQTALKLILDEEYRQAVGDRLRQVDFDATIFSTVDAPAFKTTIDSLIQRHFSETEMNE